MRQQKQNPEMHRSFKFLSIAIVASITSFSFASPAFSDEQQRPSSSVEIIKVDDGSGIIPKPGSGSAPSSPTDRGGALQLSLLGLLILFPIIAIASVRRQARRNQNSAST